MDVINLKISKVGGLTKARQIRDLVRESQHSDDHRRQLGRRHHYSGHRPPRPLDTPEQLRFSATDFNSYNTVCNAKGAPQRVDGCMSASSEPGLGIEPEMDVLGAPVAEYSG